MDLSTSSVGLIWLLFSTFILIQNGLYFTETKTVMLIHKLPCFSCSLSVKVANPNPEIQLTGIYRSLPFLFSVGSH